LCKIIQTLNGPKPDLLRLDGGGLQRSLGKGLILNAQLSNQTRNLKPEGNLAADNNPRTKSLI
jgi:hypothetical protein